jgi:FkbM family methyltransferase
MNPDFLYKDQLEAECGGTLHTILIDMRNTQWIGADLSTSCHRHGYEPEISAVIDAFVPNDGVFVDVGANWGYFPVYLAVRPGFQGRVLAFEPFPKSFADLNRLVHALQMGDIITTYPIAIGDRSGVASITDETASGLNAVSSQPHDGRIYIERLDHIVETAGLSRIDVIKIDVEGYERNVLVGAQQSIARFLPVVIFESWLVPDRETVMAPFEELGRISDTYRFYIIKNIAIEDLRGSITLRGLLSPLSALERLTEAERLNVIATPGTWDSACRHPCADVLPP